jgi:hypothetical protein
LCNVIEDVIARFDLEAALCNAPVSSNVPSIVGCWDREILDDIVSHLLSNALKYGRPIEVSASHSAGHALIAIGDHSPGRRAPPTPASFSVSRLPAKKLEQSAGTGNAGLADASGRCEVRRA